MTEVSIDLQALINRLEKVESQCRHLKLWGLLIPIILLTGGVSVEIPKPPKVISAEKICLVDKNGISRLKLELENGVPQVILAYEDGNPSMRMSGREFFFYDREQKASINILAKNTLGVSALAINDRNGKNSITLSTGPDGPYISINDNDEGKEVLLSIDPIGTLSAIESSSGKRKSGEN
jgi:hypothetical protein